MLVYKVREAQRARIPAVTHVDDTGRLQTVSAADQPALPRAHLASSTARPACRWCSTPASTSTSRSSPRPAEALACYLKTRMDVLALGNWVLTRRRLGVRQR